MKYEISQEQLQIAINLINALGNTNLFSPAKYSQEVMPYLQELQALKLIEENTQVSEGENQNEAV